MKAIIQNSNNWSEFVNKLEELGTDSSKKKEKGNSFELLVKLYLSTEPIYKSNLKNVWLHSEIPQRVIDKLNLPQPEIGIDILAEDKNSEYWVIQCKFHQDPARNVGLQEVSTFFAITEREQTSKYISQRLICTSAYAISNKITKNYPNKLGYLTFYEFSELKKDHFDCFRSLLIGEKVFYPPRKPRVHQIEALDAFGSYVSDNRSSRGKIIHPCGSGKSLTGFWCFEMISASSAIIAVPSLALVKQILRDWTRESLSKNVMLEWIAVCSDQDVSRSDDPLMSTHDIGIISTTNAEQIKKFLSRDDEKKKVVVTTYQSSHLVCDASSEIGFKFDLGIFDEAHKTVGGRDKPFAKMLWEENIAINFRLFMTATERQYRGNSDVIVSMDNNQVYGKVIHQLSFRQALEQDPPVLSDYKIITIGVSSDEIRNLIEKNSYLSSSGKTWSYENDATTLASAIALRKTISKRNIKHVLSFHRTIKRAEEFRDININFSELSENFLSLSSFHVSGKDGTGSRARTIDRFLNAEPSLLTNARCLTEGVDIPEIDAVLFADPKQSKIDIVQATGRALRRFPGKEFGYIIIPVIIDSDDTELTESTFQQIVEVISALGVSDDRIIDEFRLLVAGKKVSGVHGSGDIIIDEYPEITRVNISEMIRNVQIKTWDRLSFAMSAKEDSRFYEWMQENTDISTYTQGRYLGAIRKISNDLIKQNLFYSSLENLMTNQEPEELMKIYFEVPENKAANDRGNRMYSAAFRKLIEFHKSVDSKKSHL